MTSPTAANLYGVAVGASSTGNLLPYITTRAPSTSDVTGPNGPFVIGQEWIDRSGLASYNLLSLTSSNGSVSATWAASSGGSVMLASLTGDTGTATPSGGNIKIAGTLSQITTTASGSQVTLSFPSAMLFPGSIQSTTTITSGSSMTVSFGNLTVSNGDLILSTAGNKVRVATGSNATVGTSSAMTAGAVTVSNTKVTVFSKIFCYPAVLGTVTAPQAYYISNITPSTSFIITSAASNDTSTWHYWIIN